MDSILHLKARLQQCRQDGDSQPRRAGVTARDCNSALLQRADKQVSFRGLACFTVATMALYTVYKYVIYIPWLLLWTLVNFLGVVLVAPFSQQKASHWFGGLWGGACCGRCRRRLRITGAGDFDRRQPYIVVANHLSLMDIPILYGWLDLDLSGS